MTTRTVQLDSFTKVTTQMHIWNCPECGILYGIPADFADECRQNGTRYYCPNGHSLGWSETEADRQRKRAERAERERTKAWDTARAERERAERIKREKAAVKGQLTKAKKRIGKGVCPCCNRHFANVEKHMATQHPDYGADV